MRKHPSDSLRVIGLKKHLDDTKDQHDGNDYDEFVKLLEYHAPLTRIADIFKVTRATIYRYLAQYEHEQLNDE